MKVAALALSCFAVFFALLGATVLIFPGSAGIAPSRSPDGLTAQYGADAGGDRRRVAGTDLAVFRALAVSDLPVAATCSNRSWAS